jgi:hypothetical protein
VRGLTCCGLLQWCSGAAPVEVDTWSASLQMHITGSTASSRCLIPLFLVSYASKRFSNVALEAHRRVWVLPHPRWSSNYPWSTCLSGRYFRYHLPALRL